MTPSHSVRRSPSPAFQLSEPTATPTRPAARTAEQELVLDVVEDERAAEEGGRGDGGEADGRGRSGPIPSTGQQFAPQQHQCQTGGCGEEGDELGGEVELGG